MSHNKTTVRNISTDTHIEVGNFFEARSLLKAEYIVLAYEFVRIYLSCTVISGWHIRVRVQACGGHDPQLTWSWNELQFKWANRLDCSTPCSLSRWHVSIYCYKTSNPITLITAPPTMKTKNNAYPRYMKKLLATNTQQTLWMCLISWLCTECAAMANENGTSTAHKGGVFTGPIY